MQRWVVSALFVVSTFASPLPAGARESAKELFVRGSKDYNQGNFKKALVAFKRALELERRPSILFNVAQCYRQLGQPSRARFYYRLYQTEWERENPDSKSNPYAAEIARHIKTLSAEIERKRRRREAEKREAERREKAKNQRERERKHQLALVAAARSKERRTERVAPFYHKWWFWTVVGAVVAGAATAVVVTSLPSSEGPGEGTLYPGQIQFPLGGSDR